jgi:hypothetical protein
MSAASPPPAPAPPTCIASEERRGWVRSTGRGADLGTGSGSVSGLGRRASGEEEDEELSRNAGGRRTEKALPFLVSERGLEL